MVLSLIVLFSILPLLNTQDTIAVIPPDPEYEVVESPVLWTHVCLLIWGLISAVIIVTRLGNFCLLDRLVKRGKSLNFFTFFPTAFLMVHFMLNILLFKFEHSSKAKRLSHCLLSFGVYSILCTIPISHQAKQENAMVFDIVNFLFNPGIFIALTPVMVELLLILSRGLLTLPFRFCFPEKRHHNKISVVVELILAIIALGCLARQMYFEVGLSEVRTFLWGRNFAQSLLPNMTFVNLIIIFAHLWIFTFIKTNRIKLNPKINKLLVGLLRPEMLTLMELRTPYDKTANAKIEQQPAKIDQTSV